MEQLDDLPDALGLEVDIWDHKIASTMRDLRDIFAEVVDENAMVAPTGKVFDDAGNVMKTWNDGVPTKLVFSLPWDQSPSPSRWPGSASSNPS
jgi:hypothetical protein